MLATKEYVINLSPISWKRPGLCKKTFYDQQKHEKLAFGLYLLQQHGNAPKFTKPVHIECTFYIPIPKSRPVRESTCWCSKYPDLDNLTAFAFDAINDTGIIWKDDRIVASSFARKLYDAKPRTHIKIMELI